MQRLNETKLGFGRAQPLPKRKIFTHHLVYIICSSVCIITKTKSKKKLRYSNLITACSMAQEEQQVSPPSSPHPTPAPTAIAPRLLPLSLALLVGDVSPALPTSSHIYLQASSAGDVSPPPAQVLQQLPLGLLCKRRESRLPTSSIHYSPLTA